VVIGLGVWEISGAGEMMLASGSIRRFGPHILRLRIPVLPHRRNHLQDGDNRHLLLIPQHTSTQLQNPIDFVFLKPRRLTQLLNGFVFGDEAWEAEEEVG
jgi:hypothetical protein